MKRYSTCIVCRGDRKFPLFRGKKTGHGIPPLSCSPFITHLLTPQHRSAAKLYRSNQNSCPGNFSFSFLGNAASNFSKASGFFSQIKLQRQLHGRFIRIRQPTKNRCHIFQWSARQIIMMKLRKFWIAVLFQRQHFAKIGRECFFRPMLKLRHAVIMNLCNRGLQIEV